MDQDAKGQQEKLEKSVQGMVVNQQIQGSARFTVVSSSLDKAVKVVCDNILNGVCT